MNQKGGKGEFLIVEGKALKLYWRGQLLLLWWLCRAGEQVGAVSHQTEQSSTAQPTDSTA